MSRTLCRVFGALAAAAVALASSAVRAEEFQSMQLGGVLVAPLGEERPHARSAGFGMQLHYVADDAVHLGLGGFAGFGLGEAGPKRILRDLYDINGDFGLRFPLHDRVVPFLAAGPDILMVVTRDGTRNERGTTLGAHVRAGLTILFGSRWLASAQLTYIGAIVPGTGDDLQALAVEVGVGARSLRPERRPPPPPPPPPPPRKPEPPPPPKPERVPPRGDPPSCVHLSCTDDQCPTLQISGCVGRGCSEHAYCTCAPCPGFTVDSGL